MINDRSLSLSNRRLIGPDGQPWRVYELGEAGYDRRSSLVFESDTTIRRVRNFPSDWRQLSDAELFALSWNH